MDAAKTKKMEKKRRIIETAYQLFLNMGISATAIDDVVKTAGIARGTFYLYFKDKSDLVEQMVFYKSAETMKALLHQASTEMDDDDTDFISMVRCFVDCYIRFYAEHKDVMMVLSKNMTSFLRYFPNFFDDEAQTLYETILELFIAYGYTEEKANKMIYIVLEMLSAVCADALMYSEPFALGQLRQSLSDAAVLLLQNGANL